MAKQSGSEFATYVKNLFKRSDKDTELYEATTDIIMDMKLRLLSEDFKEEAYTTGITTLGEYRLGLPSTFGHIIGDITGLEDGAESWHIKKITKELYDLNYSSRLHTSTSHQDLGRPRHFCIYAGQIYLGPVPEDTTYQYQINYTTEDETQVTSLTSEVDFTDRYRRTLRYGVLMELHSGMENFQEAQQYEIKYEAGIQSINANDEFNTEAVEPVQYSGI